jgi:uncharacterized protein (DUF2249 family)
MLDTRTAEDNRTGSYDEDAVLLWQATARAEELLDHLIAHRPATAELNALLGYLREVVLARISEEERQVFPTLRQADPAHPDINRLRADHLRLRDDIDELATAAAAPGEPDPDQLIASTRRLIVRLDRHLRREAAALATLAGGYQASTADWAIAGHWYPLTEGPTIDMDQLRPEQAEDAVLNRLTHLRVGEEIELHGHQDPSHLWRRLQSREPGGHTWSERQDDDMWTVSVVRRVMD